MGVFFFILKLGHNWNPLLVLESVAILSKGAGYKLIQITSLSSLQGFMFDIQNFGVSVEYAFDVWENCMLYVQFLP